ncbi:uncharacterized protein LOC110378930 isoform X1 [Helicoverpa armigera]|uniref:uncharacterized protein LOC110378930 isoform X1 n=1 Tax=Helicoverpa armigera TaxID=29058 RepID=UPI003082A8E5
MSQPRMRKVVASGDAAPRARASVTKASGDSVACAARPHPEHLRSRSKNKIPKSVRYDLENALVSLCDVWFEEIKPHLVRNNIKLHVHGSSAGGDHERPPPPAAPAAPATPALPAPGCLHLDPGAAPDPPQPAAASCAGCCSTPRTASRARSTRLPTRSRRPLSPLLSVPQTPRDCTQPQPPNCEEEQVERPRTRRKKRRQQPQPQLSWRVPRLCRTYSVPSPAATGSRMRRIASQPPQHHSDHYFQFIKPRRESVMKNKTTQTNKAMWCVDKGCQSEQSWMRWRRRSPDYYGRSSRSPGSRSMSCSPRVRSFHNRSPASPEPVPRPAETSPPLSLPRNNTYRLKRPEPTAYDTRGLFQDVRSPAIFQQPAHYQELIDIIGETNDKRLRLLYSSPEKDDDDYPSYMNLFPLHADRQVKPGGPKKIPWR